MSFIFCSIFASFPFFFIPPFLFLFSFFLWWGGGLLGTQESPLDTLLTTDVYEYRFYPRGLRMWNSLPNTIISSPPSYPSFTPLNSVPHTIISAPSLLSRFQTTELSTPHHHLFPLLAIQALDH